MVSVCLPSDALLQHLPSYLGFSYLGRGGSLHCCSSKVQPLLLTLDEVYLLTAALPDLHCGIAPLGPPAPTQPRLLGRGVAPPGCHPWPRAGGSSFRPMPRPWAWGCSSWPPPLASGLGRGVSPPATKFRLKLKKVGKITRPFRYDLNQTPYDTVEVTDSRD